MFRLFIISVISLLVIGNSFGQAENEIPHLDINPDRFIKTEKDIDSIIQYAYSSPVDSSFLRKLEYTHLDNNNIHQSYHYYYRENKDDWILQGRYDYSYNNSGNYLLQEHYHWQIFNNTWRGCSQEGCGKREWAYDSGGNQILWRQSYWNNGQRRWVIDDAWEKEYKYDSYGNLVLRSHKYKVEYNSGREWDGEKDEYSYDINGNKTGHIRYRWNGGDPYDWMPLNKAEWQYNSINQLENFAVYGWNSGSWVGGFSGLSSNLWFRAENLYDSNGKISSVNLYTWDFNKENWALYYSEPVLYNSNGQIISGLEFVLYNDDYLGIQRNEFTYGTDGRLISQVKYSFNEYFASWPDPARIDTILFNFEGLIISEISWYWYQSWGGGPYLAYYKNEYDYDDLGNKVLQLGYNWDENTGTWKESHKSNWEYNENGNKIRYLVYNWDPDSNNWVGSRKDEYDFDDHGNRIKYARYYWDPPINKWIGYEKEEYGYDYQGNEVLSMSFEWNNETNGWEGIERTDREFDQNERLIMVASYGWDYELSDWRGEEEKMSWKYSPEGILTGETSFVWDTMQNGWQNKIWLELVLDDDDDPLSSSQCSWNPDNNEWEPVIKNYFYYNNNATSKEDIEVNDINIFPNPSSGTINITGLTQPANIKIYNLEGQLLKSEQQVTSLINLSDLDKGVYIMNFMVGGKRVVKKIVKE